MTNPVLESLMSHRSIRRFKDQPVPPEVLDLILKAGIRAPTAGNMQRYALVVVDDVEKRKALALSHVPLVIIALVDEYRIERWLRANNAPPECNNRAHQLFIGFWDAILALHNMVIAAESLGLGTCYYGRILETNIQELLGAPEKVFPAGMVGMGYPAESPELRIRLPREAVVHRNGYQIPTDEQIKAWYREREALWATMDATQKARLIEQGINSIPQAIANQAYSRQRVIRASQGILANLKRAGFMLVEETE